MGPAVDGRIGRGITPRAMICKGVHFIIIFRGPDPKLGKPHNLTRASPKEAADRLPKVSIRAETQLYRRAKHILLR